MTLNGIDISRYNGPASVAAVISQVDWVGVCCTEGTSVTNPAYPAQVAYARAQGKLVLHYHFFHPGISIAAQWAWFVQHADLRPGDCIALDGETTDGLPWPVVAAAEVAWLHLAASATGCSPWDYFNLYWRSQLAGTPSAAALEAFPQWLADYTYSPTVLGSAGPWPNLTAQQWTDREWGSMDGDVFLGDRATWAALAIPHPGATPASVPAPTPTTTPSMTKGNNVSHIEIVGGSPWREIPIPADGRDYAVSMAFGAGPQTAEVDVLVFKRVDTVETPAVVSRSNSWPAWQRDVPGRIAMNPDEGCISIRFGGTADQTLSVELYPVS